MISYGKCGICCNVVLLGLIGMFLVFGYLLIELCEIVEEEILIFFFGVLDDIVYFVVFLVLDEVCYIIG